MKTLPTERTSEASPQHGAALIVTLLILVLFVVIVTGFLSTARIEQIAARNYSYQSAAEQMAMVGVQRAVAQLNSALTNYAVATNVVSQPGRIIVDEVTNLLSSAAIAGASSNNINLNELQVIHTNTNTSLFRAPLVNVTNAAGQTNGRYAFWVDDEGTKANLNAVVPTSRGSFFPTNARSFGYSAVGGFGQSNFGAVISNNVSNNWPYFFSPSQIGLLDDVGLTTAREYMHFLAAGPQNLTNQPQSITNRKVNLNTLLAAVTNSGVIFHRNFLTNAAAGGVLADIDGIISYNIDRPAIINKFGANFTGKYTTDVLRQIVVNINDWPLAAGTTNSPGITGLSGAGLIDGEGLPAHVLGLRRFIHLNEVAAAIYCATNASKIQPQLFIGIEVVNPYNTPWGDASEVVVEIDEFRFQGSYVSSGSTNSFTGGWPAPAGFTFTNRVTPAGVNVTNGRFYTNANLTFVMQWDVWPGVAFSNVVISNTVKIKSVKLRQWINEPSTIRDWAAPSDFSTWVVSLRSATPNIISDFGILVSTNSSLDWSAANQTNIFGIAKNDPRVRTFSRFTSPRPAWTSVGGGPNPRVTMGSNNSVVNFSSGTGVTNISNDPSGGATDIFSHPSFSGAFIAENTDQAYRSLVELGRVHTGLQWRTLQIRRQSSGEPGPPDWALLEAFFISNNIPRININSLRQPATVESMSNAAAQMAAGLPRIKALASLFSGGSGSNASTAGLATSSAFASTATAANSARSVASNVAAMNFGTNWLARRTNGFPSNAYGLIGEVLEVSNVSDFSAATNNDFVSEGRAAAFIDALSTSSDVFTIYSVGYAVDGAGENVAEHRSRTLVKLDPATGKFRIVLTEPLSLP